MESTNNLSKEMIETINNAPKPEQYDICSGENNLSNFMYDSMKYLLDHPDLMTLKSSK